MSGNDWVGSQGDAPPDGHQMPRLERGQGELVEVMLGAADDDVTLDQLRAFAARIMKSDWLRAHVDAEVAAALEGARRETAAELWRVFLRLPHNPSPLGDYLQRRVAHFREQIPTSGGGAV